MDKRPFSYAVTLPDSKVQGSSSVYRMPGYEKELAYFPEPGINSLQKLILKAEERYGNKNMSGTLSFTSKTVENQVVRENEKYSWKTYSQVIQQSKQLAKGIRELNLAPEINEFENYNLRLTGVYSRNREEWIVLDIANALYKQVMVPLYDTLGPETISYVIGHSNLQCLFVEKKYISTLWKSGELSSLKTLVQFEDQIDESDINSAKERGIQIITWKQVMEKGQGEPLPYPEISDKDCFSFSYTSGTTGNPKAAMLSHGNLIAIATASKASPIDLSSDDVHLSYLPLPHIFERLIVWGGLYYGAALGFYGGDVLQLKLDLAVLKPTIFVSVPRLYNKFYSVIKGNFDKAGGCKGCLVNKGYNSKRESLLSDATYTSGLWDALVFNKTKNVLGGRVKRMITGSAPIDQSVLELMKIVMCCPFIEGYGQTESTGASFCTHDKDPNTGHVGGPVCCLEYKLEDVADMKYRSDDVEKFNGKDANVPRGEVCIRGNTVFLGYYKDKAKTDEAVDAQGWLHTGDIGKVLPTGELVIIDRKKNLFKLAQGEYIAPEKVENIYLTAPTIDEVWLHGDSLQSYCIVFAAVNAVNTQELAKGLGIEGTLEQLCENETIKTAILKQASDIGKKSGLKGFEQAKRIKLLPKSLTEYDVLTNTMKIKRHEARDKFRDDVQAMYALGEPQVQVKKQPEVQKA